MIKPALTVDKTVKLLITVFTAALMFPKGTWAAVGAPQICEVGANCTIGEFLFDDNYVAITGATCTLTSRDPSGNVYLNAVSMTGAADGWYSYSFTTPVTTGLYRAQVCCTPSGNTMCLDKSFEVSETASSSDIASAVWGYSSRTLSSFGSLTTDIWSSSTRTLSSFGSLVSDIWSNSSRTITGGTIDNTASAVNADLAKIKKTVDQNRLLLEQVVNKPIIINSLEDRPNLSEKLDNTKSVMSKLFINSQFVISSVEELAGKWKKYESKELSANVSEILGSLGEQTDSLSDSSLFSQLNWIKEQWGFSTVDAATAKTIAIKNTLATLSKNIDTYKSGKVPTRELKSLLADTAALESAVGVSSNPESAPTIYGKTNEVFKLSKNLDTKYGQVDKVLTAWNTLSTPQKISKTNSLSLAVAILNGVPKLNTVLGAKITSSSSEKVIKNKALALRGIISSNQLLLAVKAGQTLSNTWVEEGSMVFKTLVTNPSTLISQTVPLKYYLPNEVREENIIDVTDGLTVSYDAEKDQYFAEGEISLKASETKTYEIHVNDIWKVTDEQVATLRQQAEDLSKPLKNTSYFAQGVTLKSDINVALDKVVSLQKQAVTPEERIRAYREAQIELGGAKEKLEKLKDLVTEAGATGTLFGFVGGAQTMAVWGLMVVIIAGFVLLTVSVKLAGRNHPTPTDTQKVALPKPKTHRKISFVLPLFLIVFGVGAGSSLVTRQLFEDDKPDVLGSTSVSAPAPVCGPSSNVSDTSVATGGQESVKIVVGRGGAPVLLHEEPSSTSVVIKSLNATQTASIIEVENNWTKVVLGDEQNEEGWVASQYISEIKEEEVKTVTITNTPTGWLRVRQEPDLSAKEVGKVFPDEEYEVLDESDSWFKINLKDGGEGWISSEYAVN